MLGKTPRVDSFQNPLKWEKPCGEDFWESFQTHHTQAAGWSPFVSWPRPCLLQGRVGEGWFPGNGTPADTVALGPSTPGCTHDAGPTVLCGPHRALTVFVFQDSDCCLGFQFTAAVRAVSHVWTVSFLHRPGRNAALDALPFPRLNCT